MKYFKGHYWLFESRSLYSVIFSSRNLKHYSSPDILPEQSFFSSWQVNWFICPTNKTENTSLGQPGRWQEELAFSSYLFSGHA